MESKGLIEQTHSFKIHSSRHNIIYMGICHKKTVAQRHFRWNGSDIGGYMIYCSNGNIISSSEGREGTWRESQVSSIEEGDVLQVNYDPYKMMVEFVNKSKSQSDSTRLKFEKGN